MDKNLYGVAIVYIMLISLCCGVRKILRYRLLQDMKGLAQLLFCSEIEMFNSRNSYIHECAEILTPMKIY